MLSKRKCKFLIFRYWFIISKTKTEIKSDIENKTKQ